MKYSDLDIEFKWPNLEDVIRSIPDSDVNARNVKDGYIRGVGVRWGNVIELLSKDEVFSLAFSVAKARGTAVSDFNLVNIYMILKYALPRFGPGIIAEFGSANGGSGLFMAIVARAFCSNVQILCFDTFEGMPETDSARDAHRSGDFSYVKYDDIIRAAASLKLDNIHLIKGLLQDTAPIALPNFAPVIMTHIDVDIYESVKCAYDIVKAHMASGGYIVFDDPLSPTCIGAFEAVSECLIQRDQLHAEQVWPHLVFRAP